MMADVEFEPLHGDNEEEAEFILEKRSAKKHKQKGGQLFPRKSLDKKEKTLVIDNSKALSTAASPSKGHLLHHHHNHPRAVEGLVGPGDIQFGSSPPNYDEEGMMHSSLSLSTGNIPMSVNQTQQQGTRQRPLQLPVRPAQSPAWAQVGQPAPIKAQQRTLSQEKLTLLEQANFIVSPVKNQNTTIHDGMKTPERLVDSRRNFQTPSYTPAAGVTTPPRVASPTKRNNFSPPMQIPMNAPTGRRIERSESWGPSSHSDSHEENWADFSKSFDVVASPEDEEFETRRRRQSQVSTISEGSECSYVSEIDDSVWKINDEQRHYYVTQFKKLQPNEKGLIKGPQARDFFMKSNLPVEILSRIWHLSDLNKDSALDLEEFCIAMHLVVAVKHEVELPMVLPAMLMPKQEAESFEASFVPPANDKTQPVNKENGFQEEERPEATRKLSQSQDERWARFEAEGNVMAKEAGTNEQTSQGQKRKMSGNEEADRSAQVRTSEEAATEIQTNLPSVIERTNRVDDSHQGQLPSENNATPTARIPYTPDNRQFAQQPSQDGVPNVQSPAVKDTLSKKSSIGIARPRGIGTTINLMDAAPGQLLPPPDSRKNRKMAQQAQTPTSDLSAPVSPPQSPDRRFTGSFSDDLVMASKGPKFSDINEDKENIVNKQNHKGEIASKEPDIDEKNRIRKNSRENLDSTDGFEPPKLVPRDNKNVGGVTVIPGEPIETALRRTSSIRKGERPRSYTADSRSSMESLVDNLPATDNKDFSIPPTPPPRKTKGHKRGSSLDLNKIFGTKAQQNMAEVTIELEDKKDTTRVESNRLESLPPRIPRIENKDDKKDKKERGDIQGIARPRPAPKQHRRSISHDFAKPLAPPPKTAEGIIKDSIPTGHRKKPAPPKPSAATRSRSLERTIDMDSTKIEEPASTDKKPRHLRRPQRQKRQKHEIQAEIRLLREKNASISGLNSELQHECREAMESRTKLETRLTKTRQSFE